MKTAAFVFTILFATMASVVAFGHEVDVACRVHPSSFSVRKNVKVTVSFFGATDPQGGIIFIGGAKDKVSESKKFLTKMCRRGFSVAAFDLKGKHVTAKDHLEAARMVSLRFRENMPNLAMLAYGFASGSQTTLNLIHHNPNLFKRVVFESPTFSRSDALILAHMKENKVTRVFACGQESPTETKELKVLSRSPAQVLVSQGSSCKQVLSRAPDAQTPLLDYIEGDFAGFPHEDPYWMSMQAQQN